MMAVWTWLTMVRTIVSDLAYVLGMINLFKKKEEAPIYELIVGGAHQGIDAVALVDDPANQQAFITFSKEQEEQEVLQIALSSDEKRIITGVLLIPDQKIVRYAMNEQTGERKKFYVSFSKEEIVECVKAWSKRGTFNKVNLKHEANEPRDLSMIEIWFTGPKGKDKADHMGFDNLEGTAMISYFAEDQPTWEEAKQFKGISIEGEFTFREKFSSQEKSVELPYVTNMDVTETKAPEVETNVELNAVAPEAIAPEAVTAPEAAPEAITPEPSTEIDAMAKILAELQNLNAKLESATKESTELKAAFAAQNERIETLSKQPEGPVAGAEKISMNAAKSVGPAVARVLAQAKNNK